MPSPNQEAVDAHEPGERGSGGDDPRMVRSGELKTAMNRRSTWKRRRIQKAPRKRARKKAAVGQDDAIRRTGARHRGGRASEPATDGVDSGSAHAEEPRSSAGHRCRGGRARGEARRGSPKPVIIAAGTCRRPSPAGSASARGSARSAGRKPPEAGRQARDTVASGGRRRAARAAAAAPVKPAAPQVPQKPVRPAVRPAGVPNVPSGRRPFRRWARRSSPRPRRCRVPMSCAWSSRINSPPRVRGRDPRPAVGPAGHQRRRPRSARDRRSARRCRCRSEHRPQERRQPREAPITDDEEAAAKKKGRTHARAWARAAAAMPASDRHPRMARGRSAGTPGPHRQRRRRAARTQTRDDQAAARPGCPHAQAPSPTHVEITPPVTIRELSEAMGVKSGRHPEKAHGPGRHGHRQPDHRAGSARRCMALEFGLELTHQGARKRGRASGTRIQGPRRDRREILPRPGRHHPRPRRSRQDQPARQNPLRQRRGGRSRRHHAARRRLHRRNHRRRRQDQTRHVPRYPRPPGLHRHARPRGQHDRCGRARGRGR